ncbi:MAG: hypothetical protein WC712_00570 [Candidatus Brocadiia bacterium]
MRKTTLSLVFAVILVAGFGAYSLAANKIWVGEVKGLSHKVIDTNTYQIDLSVEEDIQDGRFGKFDEDKVVITTAESDGKVRKIIVDGLSGGIFTEKTFTVENTAIEIHNIVGSFVNPDIRHTLSNAEIFSLEMTVSAQRKISLVRVPLDKSDTSVMTISFKIILEEPAKNIVEPTQLTANVLELTPDDFEDPVPTDLVQASSTLKQQLAALNGLPEDAFVTFFYPLKNMRPSVARNLFFSKLSVWGTMDFDDNQGLLIITDYVKFVRSIAESILVFDQPIPQVEISAKVIEVTLTGDESRGFISTFKRSFPDKMVISGGAQPLTSNFDIDGISAAISHGTGDDLKEFLGVLNWAVSKGVANVLASPRALALNNENADFRVGETYNYILPSGTSGNTSKYEKTNTDSSKETSTTTNEYPGYYLRSIDTGISLNVTPSILNGNQVQCVLRLQYNEVVGFSQPDNMPILANRSLSTVVRMKDGQTLVVGGLFREKDVTTRKKVPGLGDVPVINLLFSSKQRVRVKTELVFILTVNAVK